MAVSKDNKRFSVTVSKELYKLLESEAVRRGVSVSALAAEIIVNRMKTAVSPSN